MAELDCLDVCGGDAVVDCDGVCGGDSVELWGQCYNIEIEALDLGGQILNSTIPPEIGNLVNLRVLNLSGAILNGSIPAEIGNLENLETSIKVLVV